MGKGGEVEFLNIFLCVSSFVLPLGGMMRDRECAAVKYTRRLCCCLGAEAGSS